MASPRVVLVHRRSEYEELIAHHGTRGQAGFFLSTRGQSLDPIEQRHEQTVRALAAAAGHIPLDWRRAEAEREDLGQFVFGPEDIVVVVGQDGLVANLAKYLSGQPVIGVDPLPGANAGVLVPHRATDVGRQLRALTEGTAPITERTMVQATADDGQQMVALNEIFLGQSSHQSARYTLGIGETTERQSSSGIIVGTGTGATGWCRSIQRLQAPELRLPQPAEPGLSWFVREPWPSPSTGASLCSGVLEDGEALELRVESDSLVVFGDGMEADRITLGWGQGLSIQRAERTLRTVAYG